MIVSSKLKKYKNYVKAQTTIHIMLMLHYIYQFFVYIKFLIFVYIKQLACKLSLIDYFL